MPYILITTPPNDGTMHMGTLIPPPIVDTLDAAFRELALDVGAVIDDHESNVDAYERVAVAWAHARNNEPVELPFVVRTWDGYETTVREATLEEIEDA